MIKFIDIHTHVIPCVDDGSPDIETSIFLIEEEIKQGVKYIICTPHFRRRMFETSKEKILENFNLLCEEVQKRNLDVKLFLGQETYLRHYDSLKRVLDENRIYEMNNQKYLLLEFSYTNELDLSEFVYYAKIKGFIPIIAHIERYEYVNIEEAMDIVEAGGLIQVNASSVIGKHGGKIKKKVKKLLKNNLVSFIASDIHSNRKNYMSESYSYICKKYSVELANKLFYENAKKIIGEEYE